MRVAHMSRIRVEVGGIQGRGRSSNHSGDDGSPADDAKCRMAEVYRKETQGSLLAWRAASLLLIRLLFCIKPHMRDDGKAAEGA